MFCWQDPSNNNSNVLLFRWRAWARENPHFFSSSKTVNMVSWQYPLNSSNILLFRWRAWAQYEKSVPALKLLARAFPPTAPTLEDTILKSVILGALLRICMTDNRWISIPEESRELLRTVLLNVSDVDVIVIVMCEKFPRYSPGCEKNCVRKFFRDCASKPQICNTKNLLAERFGFLDVVGIKFALVNARVCKIFVNDCFLRSRLSILIF